MALTTAERQSRFRKRLKERASLDCLGEQSRLAVDRAIAAAWAYFNRPDDDGRECGDIDGMETIAEFRASLASGPEYLAETCTGLLRDPEGLLPNEVAAFTAIVEAHNALTMKAERPAKPSGRKR